MPRLLTGIQSSGMPHLGNILGAIKPAIELANTGSYECFFFIADLHALTTLRDPKLMMDHIYAVAATWLAFGLDTEKAVFYRQSDVPQCCELSWYLSCMTPFPMLANSHAFKDKSEKLSDVNAGLFTYPILMAADILLYDAETVPVGKDQIQHLEMARDIAEKFNAQYGPTFVVPQARIHAKAQLIPGTDGQKMSKSYHNTINIFASEPELKKTVMSIVTDSIALEEPKNPDTCTVFTLYSLLASSLETDKMRQNYLAGGYGYGHAKKALFELIMSKYGHERNTYTMYMSNLEEIEKQLHIGASKARFVAGDVMKRVHQRLGL